MRFKTLVGRNLYLNQQLQLPAIEEVNLTQSALGHLEEEGQR